MGETFELPKEHGTNYVDMSGWVNVELPEEDRNRIGSEGLRRVDELAPPDGGEGDDAVGPAESGKLIDRILAVAVRESDGAASAEMLRNALKVGKDEKLKGELKDLDFCRLAACNALKDLDSLTGQDLASFAELSDDEWQEMFARDWTESMTSLKASDRAKFAHMAKAERARALLNDAVKAQEKYAKKIVDYCASRGWPVGDPQREALMQLANRSLVRAGKIKDLWAQLRDAKTAAGENGFDNALLSRRGFTDRIYFDEAKRSGIAKTLGNDQLNFNAFWAAGGTEALLDEFGKLYDTYANAGDRKVLRKDLQAAAAHNFIDGLKLPGNLMENLNACAWLLGADVIKAKLNEIIAHSSLSGEKKSALTAESFIQAVHALPTAFNAFKASMSRYAVVLLASGSQGDEVVKVARDEVLKTLAELNKSFATVKTVTDAVMATKDEFDQDSVFRGFFGKVPRTTPNWTMEERNLERICVFEGREERVEVGTKDLHELLEGTRRISPLLEAKVWGEGGLHDQDLDGMQLTDVRELGHGSFNAVKLCTFVKRDGTTVQRVFRADSGARASLATGMISNFFSKCPEDVSGFSYSHASGVVAASFGCDDVFPKTTFGTLDGQPGMFLEVAPGKTGSFYWKKPQEVNGNDDPFRADQGQLPEEVAGEVARKLNRLQWLDFLTGQIDRHTDNLMIGRADDGSVSVKGIDNDECFPEISAGNGLLVFESESDFIKQFPKFQLDGGLNVSKLENGGYKAELKPPLDTLLKDKYVVDVNKCGLDTRVEFLTMHKNYGFPDHIDEDLYNKLKDMDLDAYGERLRKETKLNGAQILAAQARLAQVQQKIAELKPNGGVYTAENWKDVEILKKINASSKTTLIGVEIDAYNHSLEERKKAKDQNYSQIQLIVSDDKKMKAVSAQTDYYAKTRFHRFLGLPKT